MKIGFTGTQIGMSSEQKENFVLELLKCEIEEFHHGDCIGADADAHDIVREFFPEVKIVTHPPIIQSKRAFKKSDQCMPPDEYLVRNKNIVNAVDVVIGAPKSNIEELRSGTWSTIRYARKMGKLKVILDR